MKTATTLIGSVIMASVIMCDATGQSRPVRAEGASDRVARRKSAGVSDLVDERDDLATLVPG